MKKLFLSLLSVFTYCSGFADAGIWEKRLRELEQLGLPYFYNADVEEAIQTLLRNDNNVTSLSAGRFQKYAARVEPMSRAHGLPWFVKYIPAANTLYNPAFTHADGSQGIWPINFTMGKKYGLRETSLWDDRNSIDKSTEAACHYLKDLQNIYKDWLKSITAFRIGALRLNQVIRLAGNQLEFEKIYGFLNADEKQVIVQFFATAVVLHYWKETSLKTVNAETIESDTAQVMCQLPLSVITENTGIQATDLKLLNPELKSDIIPWFGEPTIISIPASKKPQYMLKKDSMCMKIKIRENPPPAPVIYDTIVRIVDSVTYIEVKPRTERPVNPPPAVRTPTPSRPAPARPVAPQYVWVWYKVKPGDGLYTLSDVFDCSITQLKSWNGLRSNAVAAGKLLKFYVPAAKKRYYEGINGMTLPQKRNIAGRD